jgi:succinate-acetate transporter protein
MSTESELHSAAHAAAESTTTPAVPTPAAPNPALLGLVGFLPGGITLGLWLIGYLPTTLPGGMIAAVSASSGLFLLIACVWAARLGATTVAVILGAFSAFWLSLGLMLMGLTNNWFGLTNASQTGQVLIPYVLTWLVVFVLLTVATLRLPLVFTAGFAFVDLTFALLFISLTTGVAIFTTIAGITAFAFCVIYGYIFVDGLGQDLGAKALPMGSPLTH